MTDTPALDYLQAKQAGRVGPAGQGAVVGAARGATQPAPPAETVSHRLPNLIGNSPNGLRGFKPPMKDASAIANLARNALMTSAIGSAGVAGGMGGHALGHATGMHFDPSNPSPPMSAPARVQERADTHPANTLGTLGGLGGAGGGAGAAALALLAARRRNMPQLGATPTGG